MLKKRRLKHKLKVFIKHPYHILKTDSHPPMLSLNILLIIINVLLVIDYNIKFKYFFILTIPWFLFTLFSWFKRICDERKKEGAHTRVVQRGLKIGFIFFLLSEIMLFFAFFWAFFSASLAPTIQIGCIYPPKGIQIINPFQIPLLNTIVLLVSGFTYTYAYHMFRSHTDIFFTRRMYLQYALFTIFLGIYFFLLQFYEYINANFAINDSVYGSNFFMITGLHGFHVLVGTTFIYICYYRLVNKKKQRFFNPSHCVGLQTSVWYWHFVDVIWLFVYYFIYYWGNNI